MRRLWNPDHPEADTPDLRALAWKQAAELATVEPTGAAILLAAYEAAGDAEESAQAAIALEAARAEALCALLRQPVELPGA